MMMMMMIRIEMKMKMMNEVKMDETMVEMRGKSSGALNTEKQHNIHTLKQSMLQKSTICHCFVSAIAYLLLLFVRVVYSLLCVLAFCMCIRLYVLRYVIYVYIYIYILLCLQYAKEEF